MRLIRLLYDLYRTARDCPADVEAYVSGWDEKGATLAEGSRFIAGLKRKVDVSETEARPAQVEAGLAVRPDRRRRLSLSRDQWRKRQKSAWRSKHGRPARLVLGRMLS